MSVPNRKKALEAARRILDRVNKIRQKPTVAELEMILQAPDPPPITIKPDGSIGVGEIDEVIVAHYLLYAPSPAGEGTMSDEKRKDRLLEDRAFAKTEAGVLLQRMVAAHGNAWVIDQNPTASDKRMTAAWRTYGEAYAALLAKLKELTGFKNEEPRPVEVEVPARPDSSEEGQ